MCVSFRRVINPLSVHICKAKSHYMDSELFLLYEMLIIPITVSNKNYKSKSTNKCTRLLVSIRYIFSTSTHVLANRLPSSGGMYQTTASAIFIQIYNIWFHSKSFYACHDKMHSTHNIKVTSVQGVCI
jgi:hypothetical protein